LDDPTVNCRAGRGTFQLFTQSISKREQTSSQQSLYRSHVIFKRWSTAERSSQTRLSEVCFQLVRIIPPNLLEGLASAICSSGAELARRPDSRFQG
jgi:hypothetical protein